jgi:hypothetical protein
MKNIIEKSKIKTLVENYESAVKGGETTCFSDYVKLSSDSDPDFFRWLTGDTDLGDFQSPNWFNFDQFLQEISIIY